MQTPIEHLISLVGHRGQVGQPHQHLVIRVPLVFFMVRQRLKNLFQVLLFHKNFLYLIRRCLTYFSNHCTICLGFERAFIFLKHMDLRNLKSYQSFLLDLSNLDGTALAGIMLI